MPQDTTAGVDPTTGSDPSLDVAAAGIAALISGRTGKREAPRETAESDNATEDAAQETGSETDEQPEGDEPTGVESIDEEPVDEEATEGDDESAAEPEELSDEDFMNIARSRKHRVGDEEVDYDELVAGRLRQADYTRKTQIVSATKKNAEKVVAEAGQQRAKLDAQLKEVETVLTALMPQEPDWDAVRRNDPDNYHVIYTDWQRTKELLTAAKARRQELAAEEDATRRTQFGERVQGEVEKLLEVIPEWQDMGVRAQEFAKLAATAKKYGIDDNGFRSMDDHRGFLILRDAMRYHELVAKQKKAKDALKRTGPGPVKVSKPGSALSKSSQMSAAQKAARKLAKSGDVEDAGEAFTYLIKADRERSRR